MNFHKLSETKIRISFFLVLGILTLGSPGVEAASVECMDNLECQKGEVCLDQGSAPKGICVKRCAPLSMQLETNGTESKVDSLGNNVTKYKLQVANWGQFRDDLFTPAPDLPACGLNTNSSRSWIDIIDPLTNNRKNRFCELTQAEQMTRLFFAIQEGFQTPQKVHIIMEDRRTGRKYCSNVVDIP